MIKYSLVFVAIYLLLSVLIALALSALEAGGGTVTNLGATFVAAMVAANRFVRDHRRVPTTRERLVFAAQALAACFLASAAMTAIAWPFLMGDADPAAALRALAPWIGLVIGVAAIVAAIYFAVLYLGFGFGAQTARQ